MVCGYGVYITYSKEYALGWLPLSINDYGVVFNDFKCLGLGVFENKLTMDNIKQFFITSSKTTPDNIFDGFTMENCSRLSSIKRQDISYGETLEELEKFKQKILPILEKYGMDTGKFLKFFGRYEFHFWAKIPSHLSDVDSV